MIDHLLARSHVRDLAETLLRKADPDTLTQPDEATAQVVAELRKAVADPPGHGPADAAEHPSDRAAYVPRQAQFSLLQAMLEEKTERGHLTRTDATGETLATEVVPLNRAASPLAGRSLPEILKNLIGTPFDWTDLGWTEVLRELVETHRARLAYRLPADPPEPFPLADRARIILVGDWGTGERVATDVATAIATTIAEGRSDGREIHVIHLGDVYYAGTNWEARTRFLDPWPVPAEPADDVHSWCLNGNHDMYSAAQGLNETILLDRRFAGQRTTGGAVTTQFHLRGDRWQLVGLDSSWKFQLSDPSGQGGRLGEDQVRWLDGLAADPARGTILLSHHQPFTRAGRGALTPVGHLLDETAPTRHEHGIEAWFWGHEHRCLSYPAPADAPGLGYGACLGHGAMPEALGRNLCTNGEWEFRATEQDAAGNTWRVCGFAVVDLDPDTDPVVDFLDHRGASVHPRPLDRLTRVTPPASIV